ncbi:MAG: hypothetical protein DHS80DRAFT_18069 [Piptocephalis tieghemiana]|nr:MAG: hypothetical protein DHS80DRAFT_18069 [Piptocephalis tieghemiana]
MSPSPNNTSHSSLPSSSLEASTQRVLKDLELPTPSLLQLHKAFAASLATSLATHPHSSRELPMLPSFIRRRPTGNETGAYLALDLGGTNLRVSLVRLRGQGQWCVEAQRAWVVRKEIKSGDGVQLFHWMAECIASFLSHCIGEDDEPGQPRMIPLGWTFSFPLDQTKLDDGKLTMWNKGFTCPGVVGNDVVEMLQHALHQLAIPVRVVAILNDTVGALLASGYKDPNTVIGAIFGTGTNVAYWEPGEEGRGVEAINTEWGAFDAQKVHHLPQTRYDQELDAATANPGDQVFEKMISGLYLGELVRLILVHLVEEAGLFSESQNDPLTLVLRTRGSLGTAAVSAVLLDQSPDLDQVDQWLKDDLGIEGTSLLDRQVVRRVCEAVTRRASRLGAMSMAALLERCFKLRETTDASPNDTPRASPVPPMEYMSIGGDGSVFEHLPGFRSGMHEGIIEILGAENGSRIRFELAKDGSGIGAALAAALAVQP